MRPITLHALVRNKTTRATKVITRDKYKSKEQFWIVLEKHNYTVIRISNNRDMAAQEYGFETFSAMKKHDKKHRELNDGQPSEVAELVEAISHIIL